MIMSDIQKVCADIIRLYIQEEPSGGYLRNVLNLAVDEEYLAFVLSVLGSKADSISPRALALGTSLVLLLMVLDDDERTACITAAKAREVEA